MAIQRGLGGITHRPTRMAIGNMCLTKATFADGPNGSTQVNTAAATTYSIDGVLYSLAAANTDLSGYCVNEDGSIISAQTASTICDYLLALDSSGNMYAIKSAEEVATTAAPTRQPYLPDRLELTAGTYSAKDLCVIGKARVNTAAAWTAGTSAINTPTITYYAYAGIPSAAT